MKHCLKLILGIVFAMMLCASQVGFAQTLPDSRIVYLYVPACESCARAVEVLESLPDSVVISNKDVKGQSVVQIEHIDISARPEVARQMFADFAVPDDERITPCVFFGEHYLSGIAAIERDLANMIGQGMAMGEIEVSDETDIAPAPTVSTVGAIGAGLIAGLNTCALSMLLLFLSLILEMRGKAGFFAGCFLVSKFVCYLLIGFGLLELMQRFNPHWLQPLAKGVLTGMGAVLIILNLWDAWQAHRANYGKIRNQLPAAIRGRLHRAIRTMTKMSVLVPAVIALGFLVALGEFLCAGQLFLMQLLSGLNSGAGAQMLNLAVYCTAFIAPSAVLCMLVLGGKSHLRVSAFLAKHMAAAKLITAGAMLVLILFAWML